MAYAAVIFDLFGTLAPFSARAHDRVLATMAAALNLPPEFARTWQSTYLAQEQGTLPTLEDAQRLGRQQWTGRTIRLLAEIPALLREAA